MHIVRSIAPMRWSSCRMYWLSAESTFMAPAAS